MEGSSSDNTGKILLGVAITIGVILVIVNWNSIMNFFKGSQTTPSSQPSDYDKCVTLNKSKKDGEDCTNCIPIGSSQATFSGVIKDGECVAKPAPVRYIISNAQGAPVYLLQGNTFLAPRMPQRVPQGTEVTIFAMSANKDYAKTSYGWLSVNDIAVAKPEEAQRRK